MSEAIKEDVRAGTEIVEALIEKYALKLPEDLRPIVGNLLRQFARVGEEEVVGWIEMAGNDWEGAYAYAEGRMTWQERIENRRAYNALWRDAAEKNADFVEMQKEAIRETVLVLITIGMRALVAALA